ncbi:Ig-like domain-containing protein [Clostridium estertheticum]
MAKVDSNTGLVTAVKPGKTTITGFYKGNLCTIEVEIPEVK